MGKDLGKVDQYIADMKVQEQGGRRAKGAKGYKGQRTKGELA